MSPIIFIVLIFLVLFGVIGSILLIVLKKTDPKNQDSSENIQNKEAQGFLPFSDIRDNMILLPNQRYRMVLECTSINYMLKTPAEQDQIEASFQRFLNTITFPVSFFMQTKTIDNRERLELLDQNIKEVISQYSGVESYAKHYRKSLAELNERIGNSHQKKRYIIVSYDDVSALDSLSPEEQEYYAKKELMNRCNVLSSNLDGVGIKSHILHTEELVELIYSCYYRDDYSYADSIANKEAFSLIVHGENDHFKDMSKDEMLDLMISELKNKITLENLDETARGSDILAFINALKGEA